MWLALQELLPKLIELGQKLIAFWPRIQLAAWDFLTTISQGALWFMSLTFPAIATWFNINVHQPLVQKKEAERASAETTVNDLTSKLYTVQVIAQSWLNWLDSVLSSASTTAINYLESRIQTLEKWREDCAAWLHSYLQPIAETAKSLAENAISWISTVAQPAFQTIYAGLANLGTQLTTAYHTLAVAIQNVQTYAQNQVISLRDEMISTWQSLKSYVDTRFNYQDQAIETVHKEQVAGFQYIEQILTNTAQTLSQAIAQTQDMVNAKEKDLADAMTEEIQRWPPETDDWLLELYCLINKKVVIDGQDKLFDVISRAITGVRR